MMWTTDELVKLIVVVADKAAEACSKEKDAEIARLRAELNNVTIIHPDGAETKARRLF